MEEFSSTDKEEGKGTKESKKETLALQQIELLKQREAYRLRMRENMSTALQKDKPIDTMVIKNKGLDLNRERKTSEWKEIKDISETYKCKQELEVDYTPVSKIARVDGHELQEKPTPIQQHLTNQQSDGNANKFDLKMAAERQKKVNVALNAITKSSLTILVRTSISRHFKHQVQRNTQDIPINKHGQPQNLHYSRLPYSEEDPAVSTPHSSPKCKPLSVRTPEDFCRLYLDNDKKEKPFSLDTPDISSLCNLVTSFWWIQNKGISIFSQKLVKCVKQIRKVANDNPETWTREKYLQSSTTINKLATILNDKDLLKASTIMKQSEPIHCEAFKN